MWRSQKTWNAKTHRGEGEVKACDVVKYEREEVFFFANL